MNEKKILGPSGGDWDRPLHLIYKEGVTKRVKLKGASWDSGASKFVMDQHDPKYFNLLIGASGRLGYFVMQHRIRALLTALKCADVGSAVKPKSVLNDVKLPSGLTIKGTMTMGHFAGMTAAQQLEVIDYIWAKNATSGVYDVKLADMTEPDLTTVPNNTYAPLPSSVHPDTANNNVNKLKVGRPGTPFKTLGVGFRIDGSGANDVGRIAREGMTAQITKSDFMKNIKGWEVEQTIMVRDVSVPRLWSENLDLLNESGVCVSRTFLGATAFPERTSGDGGSKKYLLWAVSVAGLLGYDTEKEQVTKKANWRPGEKAYGFVPYSNVLGYIEIERTGGDYGENWKFKIPAGTKWTPASPPKDKAVQDYIDAELTAWSGKEFVIDGGQFDFACY